MVVAAAAGELVDRGEGPYDLAEMQTWGEERTIRAGGAPASACRKASGLWI